VSALRARCPDCRTLTAVAIGPDYQCHSCGREFAAGLVRVPRAWDGGAEETAAAAWMSLPWPEAAIVDEPTPEAQTERLRRELPARPFVLGGCAHAHVGAVRELARRHGRLGLVWLDPRDDPPELRLLVEAGDVRQDDVALDLPSPGLPGRVYVALHGAVVHREGLDALLAELPRPAGAGVTGLVSSARNETLLPRLAAALGL
jgi:hypothetical protein